MKLEPGDKVTDSAGNEWRVWANGWTGTFHDIGKPAIMAYGPTGEVKVFPAEQLTKVEEQSV